MAAIQVLIGPERRRRWSEGQKRAIVAAAFAPGAVVTTVARRADVCSGQIYRWRQELRPAVTEFAEVVVTPEPLRSDGGSSQAGVVGTADAAALELTFGDQVHLRIPPLTPPALAAAVVAALAAGR